MGRTRWRADGGADARSREEQRHGSHATEVDGLVAGWHSEAARRSCGRTDGARGARDTVERPSRRVLRSRLDAWIAPSGKHPHARQHAEDQEACL